jgi:type VI protein secretion system component Hcp
LLSTGNQGQTVRIDVVKSNDDPVMSITLQDALIREYPMLGLDDGRNVETIDISFTGIELRYFPYDSAGHMAARQSASTDMARTHHYSSGRTKRVGGTKHFHRHRTHEAHSRNEGVESLPI